MSASDGEQRELEVDASTMLRHSTARLSAAQLLELYRLMVLNRGELIANGTVEDIRNDPLVQEVYLGGGSVFSAGDTHA